MPKYMYSPIKQKALLLFASGLTLGLTHSSRVQWKIVSNLPRAWREINRTTLRRIVKEFHNHRLVDFEEDVDGNITIILTELGRQFVARYNPDKPKIQKPKFWDKKWRIVAFDIPEKHKKARDALRWELKKIGFLELQRSVWIFPYDCKEAVDVIVELFGVRSHVRYMIVEKIMMDADIRLSFDLK